MITAPTIQAVDVIVARGDALVGGKVYRTAIWRKSPTLYYAEVWDENGLTPSGLIRLNCFGASADDARFNTINELMRMDDAATAAGRRFG